MAINKTSSYPFPTCQEVIDPLSADDVLTASLLKLLQRLIPTPWSNVENIKLNRLSGALTNCVYYAESDCGQYKVLIRVYGQGSEQLFLRSKELLWLSRLSKIKLVPGILAMFGNGRFEEYLESKTLRKDDLRDPQNSVGIARLMKKLHMISQQLYPPSHNEPLEWWSSVLNWLPKAEEAVKNMESRDERAEEIDFAKLKQELKIYKKWVESESSPIVFGHNDLQYGNILLLKEGCGVDPSEGRCPGDITFVDFEYGGYNPRGYDIANHFCEWQADYHGDEPHILQPIYYPSVSQQYRFLAAYLDTNVNDPRVTDLQKEVERYRAASEIMWTFWGLLQVDRTDIDFDYLGYGLGRLREFRRLLRKQRVC